MKAKTAKTLLVHILLHLIFHIDLVGVSLSALLPQGVPHHTVGWLSLLPHGVMEVKKIAVASKTNGLLLPMYHNKFKIAKHASRVITI